MPWTLYRYILKDLLKLLFMSLLVLVIVISVAVAIRPLTKGQLSAWTLVKFIGLSCPTILDLALPFASAFASTLVFHRMICDNEIVACRASGMSFRMIFAPVIFLGLLLTVLMFLLSSWVIPEFSRLAAKTIQTDVINVVVNELRDKHVFKQGDNVIHADKVQEIDLEPGDLGTDKKDVKKLRLVMLQGVAFGQLDDRGRMRHDTTVERADLILYHKDDLSWMTLRLHNVEHYSKTRGHAGDVEHKLILPNPFRNNLRFQSAADLRKLEQHPEKFRDVNKFKIKLCARLAERVIFDHILKQFNATAGKPDAPAATTHTGTTGTFTLMGMTDDYQYVIHAAGAQQVAQRDIKLIGTKSQPIQIDFYLSGKPYTRTTTDSALLVMDFNQDMMTMELQLGQSEVVDLRKREGYVTQHAKLPPIKPLRWPDTPEGPIMDVLMKRSVFDLEDAVAQRYSDDKFIMEAAQQMHDSLIQMGWDIMALRHQRAASSMGCFLILLLGAMMTCYMQGSTPLVVYFWSFALAAVAVIITRSSENMMNPDTLPMSAAALMIWSGNLVVLAVLIGLGLKLSKPR